MGIGTWARRILLANLRLDIFLVHVRQLHCNAGQRSDLQLSAGIVEKGGVASALLGFSYPVRSWEIQGWKGSRASGVVLALQSPAARVGGSTSFTAG